MTKLHPLHTVEALSASMALTGHYPDTERCTGRTTAIALGSIAAAIRCPFKPVHISDHFGTREADTLLLGVIRDMVLLLYFEHFYVNRATKSIQFGRPDEMTCWEPV